MKLCTGAVATRRIKGGWLVFCLLALLSWAASCLAQPSSRILQLEGGEQTLDLQPWLELRRTPSDVTFADILSGGGAWTAASNYTSMHFGYSADALWMKLNLQSAAPRRTLWYIHFPYSSLSKVSLFQEGQAERVSGQGVPVAERDSPHRNAIFSVWLDPGEQVSLYLRAESAGSLGVSSQLWSTGALASHSVSSTAVVTLYCGLLLGLGLYHLLIAGILRDSNCLLYGSHLLLFVLAVIAFSGLGARYLWPDAGEWGTRVLPFGLTAANACVMLLLRNLYTSPTQADPWRRVFAAAAGVSGLLAVASLVLVPSWVSRTIPWLASGSTLLAVIYLIRCARLGLPEARLFLLSACLVALSISLFVLRAAGVLPLSMPTDLAVRFVSLASILTISYALARRIHLHTRRQLSTSNMTLERLQGEHQQTLEELQATSSQLHETRLRLQHAAYEDPLTGLPNRAALERHINQTLRRSRRRALPLAVMLIDLDGFKHLHEQLGDDTAERLVLVIAERLAEAARENDFVARMGGDEFVLVAEEVADRGEAQLIAERLLDALLPSIELEDQSISVGVSIGVTLSHAADLDMSVLLRQADAARYSRKNSGRGGVSFHPANAQDDPVV